MRNWGAHWPEERDWGREGRPELTLRKGGIWLMRRLQRRMRLFRDFPGGPAAETALPIRGSLVRELDPACHS